MISSSLAPNINPSFVHGGPDTLGIAQFDFSTNANACGPCPQAMLAVQLADATQYPDPSYTQLRMRLATFHAVEPARVLLAASASEFIFRMTGWAARHGLTNVVVPKHGYGDYVNSAEAFGLRCAQQISTHSLAWVCDPSSPLGQAADNLDELLNNCPTVVLDRAYEPLRLQGALGITPQQLDQVWQLWTPNKALGMTGVRAAYAIAPLKTKIQCEQLEALCPSWPVGAHGVAMLNAWVLPESQQWISDSLVTLRGWKARQLALCRDMGWQCLPSNANFFCVQPKEPPPMDVLRAHGIKLRDCTSFGLLQHWRLSVQAPAAQDALVRCIKDIT